ncbi:protein LAX PANICLE 2-like isoform X2 [Phragmites australis]|uniref:protein LAX PANICLE 2-like isoform X2 n=1 Tax=Phragmites australis TaxID=29695 RepID=UPI002D76BDD2|nr:protein LAX PANICLE 2-like isoform X2 [Phragmites australis]
MVTLLRPHRHAHGPAAVTVRLSRSQSHQPPPSSSLRSCRSVLRPMAQDPSHPHRQSKDPASPPQQPEQPEIAQQPAPAQPQQPPREVQEVSTSSSSGSDAESSWLQLGIGTSPGSPSPSSSRRKRQRTDEAGPSTSVHPAAPPPPPPPPQLQLSLHPGPSSSSGPAAVGAVVAAAPPPPAHEAGTWFLLQAAQNQRDPPLLQIPRSYLRVRDGRMTVRVVMRYLVNKLGLEDDSQLEITCRGQRLLPTMTLQQVRDTIWRLVPAEAAAVLPAPGSPSTNQIMTLHYGRS